MSQQRKQYSPEKKVQILKEHLVDRKPVSEICDHYGINPVLFYRWQKQFFEHGTLAFQQSKDKQTAVLEKKISKLEQKLSQKNEVLSEHMEAHVALKKNLGEL